MKSGDVGVVAASGTGLQEVAVLFHNADRGLSHGIGVGGRDLHDEIGAISTLRAIEWLEEDVQTRHILLISKPPGPQVTKQLMTRLARSSKPVTVCLLGATDLAAGPNVAIESTLKGAVQRVTGQTLNDFDATRISSDGLPPQLAARQGVLGLFSGGTLATEAAIVMARSDVRFEVIDLGADEYTVGRPHPMIDPSARMIRLERALQDSELRVVLLDVVLGLGSHRHPAGAICEVLARAPANSPAIVAYVCGTEDDPQSLSKQTRALEQAGVLLAPTNADAAMLASAIAGA
ncbi:MAG: hypothetical protein HOI95_24455 [Chromatiales bacterium]|nr:hypothetical protein [Chromatiales bacterium]